MSGTLERARRLGLGAAIAGLGPCAAGAFVSPARFFEGYLFAWVFWLGVALGCLAIAMIQHLTGGAWGLVIRRLLESGARTIPFMALLFIPLLFGLDSLFIWARPEEVARDALLQHKSVYLNVPFFLARAAACFAIWSALAWKLSQWSRRQDETGDPGLVRRFQILSSAGLLAFVLTMTFASVDWVMSLEPHWWSTIYGVLLMAGQAVSAFCFVIGAAILLSKEAPLSGAITHAHLHDLGKLLFAFVMVWAYFALSQFLIIWSGNLPEEIPWYLRRLQGGWEWVGLGIILLHFALPFLLLLARGVKRDPRSLLKVAVLVFVMRLVDTYWMMAPAFSSPGAAGHAAGQPAGGFHWLHAAAAIGLGGLWVWLFVRQVEAAPLLPRRDPDLEEALAHGAEEHA